MTDRFDLERSLRRALELTNEAGVRAALVEGLAVSVWAESRATKDVDLIVEISAAQMERFVTIARGRGYAVDDDEIALFHKGGGFLRLLQDGRAEISLDVLAADTELHLSALARSSEIDIGGQTVRVISAEDLILMKLIAFRSRDTFDIEMIVDKGRESLDLTYLREWADRLKLRKRLEVFLEDPREP